MLSGYAFTFHVEVIMIQHVTHPRGEKDQPVWDRTPSNKGGEDLVGTRGPFVNRHHSPWSIQADWSLGLERVTSRRNVGTPTQKKCLIQHVLQQ